MTIKFNIKGDDIARYLHASFGGEWGSSGQDDGRYYRSVSLEYDSCRISVDLREFLSAYLGHPADNICLTWDPYNWEYSAKSL